MAFEMREDEMKLVATNRTGEPTADSSYGSSSAHFRILIAEDDLEMRRLLAWSLKQASYEVVECQDGTTLMKKLGLLGPQRGQQPIDLVISDIRMPGATGLQFLENAQGMDNAPPVILISAFADRETFAQAARLGAATLLPKPFDMDELLVKVRELLPLVDTSTTRERELQPAEPDIPFPLEVTFRHGPGSEPVKEFIEQLARKMTRFGEHILHCRVVINTGNGTGPARRRHHVSLIISTPGHPIVVEHEANTGSEEENLYLALHVVFSTAYRQLKQKHQKRRSHVDKKNQTRREGQ
jgi:CheY-like chemotaxis protein/ribosome-associated translation inhibitor RaiA